MITMEENKELWRLIRDHETAVATERKARGQRDDSAWEAAYTDELKSRDELLDYVQDLTDWSPAPAPVGKDG